VKVKLHPLITDPIEFRVGDEILNLTPGQEIEVGEPSAELQHHLDTNGVFVGGEHPTYVPLLVFAPEEAWQNPAPESPVAKSVYNAQVHQAESFTPAKEEVTTPPVVADEPGV
jgi:hypothetical protein